MICIHFTFSHNFIIIISNFFFILLVTWERFSLPLPCGSFRISQNVNRLTSSLSLSFVCLQEERNFIMIIFNLSMMLLPIKEFMYEIRERDGNKKMLSHGSRFFFHCCVVWWDEKSKCIVNSWLQCSDIVPLIF